MDDIDQTSSAADVTDGSHLPLQPQAAPDDPIGFLEKGFPFERQLENALDSCELTTSCVQHDALRINVPMALQRWRSLPEGLRNCTLRVGLECDRSLLLFDVFVAEGHPAPKAPVIVRDGVLPDLYTLDIAPIISAEHARSLIAMLMRYSKVKALHINTH